MTAGVTVESHPTVAPRLGSGLAHRRAAASVSFDSARAARVTTVPGGKVLELRLPRVGERVRAGQVLARLWTAEVGSAVAELRLLSQDPVLRAAAEGRLRALGAPTDAEVDGTWHLRAPLSGVVTARLVDAGAFLAPGAALAEIAPDAARLAEFYTVYPPVVGTPVSFSDGTATFAGTVQSVLPAGNAAGTGVRAVLEGQPAVGRPLLATWDEALPEGLWIPRAALVDTGARSLVFVVEGTTARPRDVHVVARSESEVMVHGLDPADRVVASGAFWLDADTQVAGGDHAGHGGH